MSVATAMTDSAHQSVSGQKQGAKIEAGWVQLFSFLFNKNLSKGVLIFQSQFLADKVSFLKITCKLSNIFNVLPLYLCKFRYVSSEECSYNRSLS